MRAQCTRTNAFGKTANRNFATAALKIYALIIIMTSALARASSKSVQVCVCICTCVRCVYGQVARGRADGEKKRGRKRECRSGNRSMRGEQESLMDVCKEASQRPPQDGGGGYPPPLKMATTHSSILSGHDRTALREINHRSTFRIYAASSYANRSRLAELPDKSRTNLSCEFLTFANYE